jgi:hypothetical protein
MTGPAAEGLVSHAFVRAGCCEYLSDCTQRFAAQTVPPPPRCRGGCAKARPACPLPGPGARDVTTPERSCEAVGIPAEDLEGRSCDIPWCITHRRWHEDCQRAPQSTALPPAGAVPGASMEILLAALHLLRCQADLFVGYLDTTQPGTHDLLASFVRSRCEEVMLEVDMHLSILQPGAAS